MARAKPSPGSQPAPTHPFLAPGPHQAPQPWSCKLSLWGGRTPHPTAQCPPFSAAWSHGVGWDRMGQDGMNGTAAGAQLPNPAPSRPACPARGRESPFCSPPSPGPRSGNAIGPESPGSAPCPTLPGRCLGAGRCAGTAVPGSVPAVGPGHTGDVLSQPPDLLPKPSPALPHPGDVQPGQCPGMSSALPGCPRCTHGCGPCSRRGS